MTAIDNMRLHARSVKLLTSYWHAVLVGETCGSYRLARPVRIASFAAVYKLQRQIRESNTADHGRPTNACHPCQSGMWCQHSRQSLSHRRPAHVAHAWIFSSEGKYWQPDLLLDVTGGGAGTA